MSTSSNKSVVKELQSRDIDILRGLYEYRALSTEQIMRYFRISKWYTYKKLTALRNSGYIITTPIKGYNPHQSRQGNYHRISETGIACLRKQGYPAERRAYDLRVRIRHLPFLLMTNDILMALSQFNWTVEDSRAAKKRHNLNRGVNIQGILKNACDQDYVLYSFLENTSVKNLEKIASEITMHKFTDYLFICRGGGSFQAIINRFIDSDAMLKCQSLKVFPRGLGKDYLRAFEGSAQQFNAYLQQVHNSTLSFRTSFKRRKNFKGLDQVVHHNGEEKYLVNLLDTDLVKIYNMKRYRKEDYEMDGRKVLVITEPHLKSIHHKLLESVHHIDYMEITQDEIKAALHKDWKGRSKS
ncbi:replication-relaxation family protein [Oceanobacillus damuensis]|uniref:replication-relaxation family protein n=1 Tax=Oceanobacillus damuensis TaxID=937928 RepID=UPI000AB58326|nr:replication-relaxation family protein [Oceanobacillus damuensis]